MMEGTEEARSRRGEGGEGGSEEVRRQGADEVREGREEATRSGGKEAGRRGKEEGEGKKVRGRHRVEDMEDGGNTGGWRGRLGD